MNALPTILLSLSLLGSPDSDPGWIVAIETSDGITVSTRDKPNTEVKEIRAVGLINAPAEAVWKVLRDYQKYPERIPYVEVSEVVAPQDGGPVMWVYQRITAPFLAKRDYTLKITDDSKWENGQGFFKSSWTTAPDKGPPPKPDVVRLRTVDGFWKLEPRNGGKRTFATYYLVTDPGGAMPKFLANQANCTAMPDVFRAFRRYSTSSKEGVK